jgi:hypothetical protein
MIGALVIVAILAERKRRAPLAQPAGERGGTSNWSTT